MDGVYLQIDNTLILNRYAETLHQRLPLALVLRLLRLIHSHPSDIIYTFRIR